jgi:hypothetical protein
MKEISLTPVLKSCGIALALFIGACGGTVEPTQAVSCDGRQRDQCLQTKGCFLDHGGQPDSYTCRAAKNDCEKLTNDGGQAACQAQSGCTFTPGSCYCPEGTACLCGGGPPPMCRAN